MIQGMCAAGYLCVSGSADFTPRGPLSGLNQCNWGMQCAGPCPTGTVHQFKKKPGCAPWCVWLTFASVAALTRFSVDMHKLLLQVFIVLLGQGRLNYVQKTLSAAPREVPAYMTACTAHLSIGVNQVGSNNGWKFSLEELIVWKENSLIKTLMWLKMENCYVYLGRLGFWRGSGLPTNTYRVIWCVIIQNTQALI